MQAAKIRNIAANCQEHYGICIKQRTDTIKMVIPSHVINIFHETCTIGFSTHRAINLCQNLMISCYEKLQMVYFSIAGHKILSFLHPVYGVQYTSMQCCGKLGSDP